MNLSRFYKYKLAALLMNTVMVHAHDDAMEVDTSHPSTESTVQRSIQSSWHKKPFSNEALSSFASRLINNFGSADAGLSFFVSAAGVEFPIYYEAGEQGQYRAINFQTLFENRDRPAIEDLGSVDLETFKSLYNRIAEKFPEEIKQTIVMDSTVTPQMAFNALLGNAEELTQEVRNWQNHYATAFRDLLTNKQGKTALNLATVLYKLNKNFDDPQKQEEVRDLFFTFILDLTTHCSAGFEARVDTVFSRYGDDNFSLDNLIQDYKESILRDLIVAQCADAREATSVAISQWFRYKLEGFMGLSYVGEELSSSIHFIEIPQNPHLRGVALPCLAKWLSLHMKPSLMINQIKASLNQYLAVGTPNSAHYTVKIGDLLKGFTGISFDFNDNNEFELTTEAVEYLLAPYLTIVESGYPHPGYPQFSQPITTSLVEELTPDDIDMLLFRSTKMVIQLKDLPQSMQLQLLAVPGVITSTSRKLVWVCHLSGNIATAEYLASMSNDQIFYDSIKLIQQNLGTKTTDIMDFSPILIHPHLYFSALQAMLCVGLQNNDMTILSQNVPLLMQHVMQSYGVLVSEDDLNSPDLYTLIARQLLSKNYPSDIAQRYMARLKELDSSLVRLGVDVLSKLATGNQSSNPHLHRLKECIGYGKISLEHMQKDALTKPTLSALGNYMQMMSILDRYRSHFDPIVCTFEKELVDYIFKNGQDAYALLQKLPISALRYIANIEFGLHMLNNSRQHLWPRLIGFSHFVKMAVNNGDINSFHRSYGPLIGTTERETLTNLYTRYGIKIRSYGDNHLAFNAQGQSSSFYWGEKLWLPSTRGDIPFLTGTSVPPTQEGWAEFFDTVVRAGSGKLFVNLLQQFNLYDVQSPFFSELIHYLELRPKVRLHFIRKLKDEYSVLVSPDRVALFEKFFDLSPYLKEIPDELTVSDYAYIYGDMITKETNAKVKRTLKESLKDAVLGLLSKVIDDPLQLTSFLEQLLQHNDPFFRALYTSVCDHIRAIKDESISRFLKVYPVLLRCFKNKPLVAQIVQDGLHILQGDVDLSQSDADVIIQSASFLDDNKLIREIMGSLLSEARYTNKYIEAILSQYISKFWLKKYTRNPFCNAVISALDTLVQTPEGCRLLTQILRISTLPQTGTENPSPDQLLAYAKEKFKSAPSKKRGRSQEDDTVQEEGESSDSDMVRPMMRAVKQRKLDVSVRKATASDKVLSDD
ncbi:MAG: hypothetical protein KF798_00035 [Candidatus Paracaedibacteraceae bacterium]|nr:hypothetical protein [Candidatus Paracaedibacteraceae bacterium]